MLSSCEAVPKQTSNKKGMARVTFYNKHEDKYGNKIASSNTRRARRGRTIAAEKSFPFGTVIQIPWLAKILGSSRYVVEDRGSAINSRRASGGKTPVFDIYTDSKKETNRLAAIVPPYLPYEIQ
jgi:3D (Asp-Asp-Asp) domain-containing protein